MNLLTLQSALRDLIAADPYFTGNTVISDNGLIDEQIEGALSTKGACIVVRPVIRWGATQNVATHSFGGAALLVEVLVNPYQNAQPSGAGWVPLEAAIKVVQAANGLPEKAGKRWLTAGDIELLSLDSGLFAYGVQFSAQCKL